MTFYCISFLIVLNQIYPDCKLLRMAIVSCTILGIFPWQFICPENPYYQRAYKIYSTITLSYFISFLFLAYIELIKLCREEYIRIDEILRNFCVSLLCTITLIRLMIMRIKPHIRNIIQEIIQSDKYIFATYDQQVLNIYNKVIYNTKKHSIVLYILIAVVILMHDLRTFAVKTFIKRGNETVPFYTFPVSASLPFDEQENFWAAYITLMTMGINAATFLTFIDVLIFSLIMYVTSQLEILNHILRNFDEYKEKVKYNLEEAVHEDLLSEITFKQCINMHRVIIRYINSFNACMSVFMVFDFLQTSVQLASIMSEMVLMEFSLYTVCFVVTFVSSSTYRLYMFYYYANEVVFLSESLPLSLFQSNWYNQPKKVKYMMRIFMLRCQTPLVLTIGPFGQMTLYTFMSILRASYSYSALIYNADHK